MKHVLSKGVKRRLNLESLNYGYEDVTPLTAKRLRKWSSSSAGSEPSPAQNGKNNIM